MAELIRKDKLIDWSYREPTYYDSMNDRTDMRDFINGLSTTTEAEIRAKAIDEFAEKLKEFYFTVDDSAFRQYLRDVNLVSEANIKKIAEQLKEE